MSTAASVPAPGAPSPWFRSAPFDLLFILAVPFVTWPLLRAAQSTWGAQPLTQLILVSATGHYFATFVRAYGDRELFARFRQRLLLAPALLLPTFLTLFVGGHGGALMLVVSAWAFWHWLAQAFGFARIYDAKIGSHAPLTAWLDKALVIAGFLGAITLNDGSLATFGKLFLDAGVPLPSAERFRVVQFVMIGALALVGSAYVANLLRTIASGRPWSWQKQFMHATTIGYYWFAFAWVDNVLIAYVLYELFHDVQYYAITWLTGRQRVRRPGVTPWFAFLFRPGALAALVFLGAMLGFGALDYGARTGTDSQTMHDAALAFAMTAAVLHYYYDGFLWKARERTLGSDLGIAGGLQAAVVPALRHGAAWSLFALPLLALLSFATPVTDARTRAEALAGLAPGDFLSQADLAFALAGSDLPAALASYRASIAANPDYATSRANYGAALEFAGELEPAREQYERALALPDTGSVHGLAHVNLGVLLLLRGDRAGALAHFDAGARLGGEDPTRRMLALAQALPAARAEQRQKLWNGVLQLSPDQPDARLALGDVALQQRRFDAAIDHYTVFLRRYPMHVPAIVGLAEAQAGRGQLDAARATLQQALQHEPGNARALALQARLAR